MAERGADGAVPDGAGPTNERSPLLTREPVAEPDPGPEPEPALQREHPGSLYRQTVLLLVFAFLFLIEMGAGMMVPPQSAIQERIICHQVNPQLDDAALLAGDPLCKSPEVQGRLAMLRGWLYAMESFPGLFLSIPYGLLSDKWGRKPVLFLSITGAILSNAWQYVVMFFPRVFPIWMVLLSPIFELIGGSTSVTVAMISTILADVVPVATRAIAFFQLTSVFLVAELVSSPLAGLLMGSDESRPWVALFVALGMMVLSLTAVLVLPETLGLREGPEDAEASADRRDDKPGLLTQAWDTIKDNARQVWVFILGNRSIALLILSLVFLVFGRFVTEVLLQYSTKRYGWTWRKASFFLSIRGAVNLVMFLVVLPAISYLLTTRCNMLPIQRDLLMARASGVIFVLGLLVIAFAVNPYILGIGLVIFSCGQGLRPLALSLLNSLVEPHHVGVLNSVIGVMITVGIMVASPVLMESLSLGIRWGGLWIGLPFLIAALSISVATAIVMTFKAVPKPFSDSDTGDAGETISVS